MLVCLFGCYAKILLYQGRLSFSAAAAAAATRRWVLRSSLWRRSRSLSASEIKTAFIGFSSLHVRASVSSASSSVAVFITSPTLRAQVSHSSFFFSFFHTHRIARKASISGSSRLTQVFSHTFFRAFEQFFLRPRVSLVMVRVSGGTPLPRTNSKKKK